MCFVLFLILSTSTLINSGSEKANFLCRKNKLPLLEWMFVFFVFLIIIIIISHCTNMRMNIVYHFVRKCLHLVRCEFQTWASLSKSVPEQRHSIYGGVDGESLDDPSVQPPRMEDGGASAHQNGKRACAYEARALFCLSPEALSSLCARVQPLTLLELRSCRQGARKGRKEGEAPSLFIYLLLWSGNTSGLSHQPLKSPLT